MYRALVRDGKVFSCLQKRKLSLVARPWTVEPLVPGAQGQKDAEVVRAMLKGIQFDRVCMELMDALLVGFVPSEIVWTYKDGLYTPARILKRAQRRFVYVQPDPNEAPQLRLLTAKNMLTGEELEPRKFIVHRINPEDDNPYGTGLGLQLYWPVFFKRNGILSWNKLNDRFGSPTPWGKYPVRADDKAKQTLFNALQALSSDGMLMTPEGMQIELLESKLTGSVSTQKDLCAYMDAWINEVVLSQEPGVKTGASASAANEREDVRLDLVQADADLLSDTINSTLVAWFCAFNGLSPCMVSRVIKKPEDLKSASETDVNIASMGFRPTLDAVRARYGDGWEEAKPPAPAAQVPQQQEKHQTPNHAEIDLPQVPQQQEKRLAQFAEHATPGVADPTQQLTDELTSAAAPALAGWIAQVQSLVDQADSLNALQDAMVQAFGALDSAVLVKLMAAAFALAELKGIDDVRNGQ